MPNSLNEVMAHVWPIFKVRSTESNFQPIEFCGTGFVLVGGLFITCWHCTRQPLEPGQYYAAAYPAPNAPPGGAGLIILKDLAQDEGGLDLAIARVSPPIAPRLLLTEQPAAIGEDVYTLGFPLVPPPVRVPNGNLIFDDVDRRFLRGYITKIGTIKLPSGYEIDAIEVDMLVPPGISGAPLLRSGTMEVIGVIVGNHSSYSIEVLSSVNPNTGEVTAEVRSQVNFGIAHQTQRLWSVTAPALSGKTLKQYS